MHSVDAVKSKEEIRLVEHLLRKHGSDLYGDIWKIGINLSLRISDLLNIKVKDLDLENRHLTLIEQKTGKRKDIRLNQAAIDTILNRLALHPEYEYLFQVDSNRAKDRPGSRESVARKFKEVGDILGVRLGTHSMRKSRGYAMYADGVPLEMICKVLNHSTPSVTMSYLGITREEVLATYDDYQL